MTELHHEEKEVKADDKPIHHFVFSDGTKASDLKEMADAVFNISKETFDFHVNDSKNDIADWVANVHEKNELAKKLREINNKEDAAKTISNYKEQETEEAQPAKEDIEKEAQSSETASAPKPQQEENEKRYVQGEIQINVEEEGSDKNIQYDKTETIEPKLPFGSRIRKLMKKVKIPKKTPKKHDVHTEKTHEHKPKRIHLPDPDSISHPEYIQLGVPGFDEMITNGVPKGSSVLLCGGAGTGKTTFSLQILANGAQKGEKCLYLTFEEDISRLRAHMIGFGWDPLKLQKDGNFLIKKMDSFEVSRSVEALLAKASGELIIDVDEVEGIIPAGFKPDKIVLDSLSAVSAAFAGKEDGYRIYVEQLFNLFKRIGATSFLISEVEEESNKYTRSGIEEFLADAVIVFYNLRQKSVRVNALEIIKIRGTKHEKKVVPFKIMAEKGITVFPKEDPFLE